MSRKTLDGIEMIVPEKVALVRKTKDGEMRVAVADLMDLVRDIAEDATEAALDEAREAIATFPVPKDGNDGKDGKDGERGPPGKDGEPGKDGRDGIDGRDGVDGRDGKDGKDGKDGRDGKDGAPGRDGKDGKPGPPGPAGRGGGGGAWVRLKGPGGADVHGVREIEFTGGVTVTPNGGHAVVDVSGGGGGMTGAPTFIQATPPDPPGGPYAWWDTSGGNLTLWIEDGT